MQYDLHDTFRDASEIRKSNVLESRTVPLEFGFYKSAGVHLAINQVEMMPVEEQGSGSLYGSHMFQV